ncbi:MAG: hypothetical protein ACLSWJ_03600 [Alphaproteobacteria bacterium]
MVHIPNIHDSKWIFIAGSETRFVFDVVNAANIVQQKQGNCVNNIYFFTDCSNAAAILSANDLPCGQLFGLDALTRQIELFDDVSSIYCAVSSHGDIDGIENKIKPNELIHKIENIKGLTDGFVLFGQCYSGIFNLTDQSKLCVLGASNFYPSISSSEASGGKWVANVFFYFFFEWFKNPVDVDGDKQHTIADAYKWASYKTNNLLIELKIRDSKTFNEWCIQEQKNIELLKKNPIPANIMDCQVREAALNNRLNIYHNQQEAWISNCDAALRLIVKV